MIVSLIIMLGLAVVGVAVVRTNLRSLDDIEETAEEIAAGHLDRRVPDRDPRTEVGRLGRSINMMLAQIESAFHDREQSEEAAVQSEERMRRFIADASHELRTPLTAIRGFAEYYRQRGGVATPDEGNKGSSLNPEDLDRIMQRVEGEAARMGVLVEDLLLLARLDQQRPIEHRPVDLLVLAADAVQDTRMIAPGRPVQLTVEPGKAFLVLGDEVRLRQVIGNLMTNALTHTPDGTPVDVRLGSGFLPGPPPHDPGARPGPSRPPCWTSRTRDRGSPPSRPGGCSSASTARTRRGTARAAAAVSAWPSSARWSPRTAAPPPWSRLPARARPSASRCRSRRTPPAGRAGRRTRQRHGRGNPLLRPLTAGQPAPRAGTPRPARYESARRGGVQAESAARAAATTPSR